MPQHNQLTGSDLHEPKGVASAAVDTTYIANGSGSGSWAKLNTYRTTKIVKTADTSRTNNATISADPDLTFSPATSSKYLIRLVIFGTASTNADIQFRCDTPTGATGNGAWIGRASGGTVSDTVQFNSGNTNFDTSGDSGKFYFTAEIYLTTSTTAGSFSFSWAQNVSSSSASTIKAGSYLEYQKIA